MIEQAAPLVTVGICTRNRAQTILAATKSVLANTFSAIDLIIVDQSTNPDTANALADVRSDPRVRYIATDERGVCRARNLILAQARSEIVLMTDDDCLVPTDWIERMVDTFNQYPHAALVFSRVDPVAYDPTTSFVPVFQCNEEYVLHSLRQVKPHGIGASMGMRCAAVKQIGGFDIHLGPGSEFNSGEDQDLCYRLVYYGFDVVITPRTSVMHDGVRSHNQVGKLIKRDVTASGAVFAKHVRHGNYVILLHLGAITKKWLQESIENMLRMRPPRALRRIVWLYWAMFKSFPARLDHRTLRFSMSKQQALRYETLRIDA